MGRSIISGLLLGAASVALATPAFAGPPFLTDDPDPTAYRQYEIYLFTNGVSARDGTSGAYGLDFNYGAGHDLQLSGTAPINYERPRGTQTNTGLGNIELAAKVRVLHQESFGWNLAVFPRLFLPAGSNLGDNHASFLLPIWIGRSGDDWSTFGGGGCALNRGGDSDDYCIAGWAFARRVAPSLQVGAEVFHQCADTKDGSASTILGLGSTYDITEHLHVLSYIGAGLQNTAENGRGTGYASVLFTF